VNESWRAFARANGADARIADGVGVSYLDVLRRVRSATAGELVEAVQALLAGERESASQVYSCHSPTQPRWFRLEAKRIDADGTLLVSHTDVSEQGIAEASLRVRSAVAQALTERVPLMEFSRRLMRVTGEAFGWDFAVFWIPDAAGNLCCMETWSSPGTPAHLLAGVRNMTAEASPETATRAWTSRSPYWVANFDSPSTTARSDAAARAGFRSNFAAPVGAGREMFAIIEFFSRSRREPDLTTIELLLRAGARFAAEEYRARELAQRASDAPGTTVDAVMRCMPAFVSAIDPEGKVRFLNRSHARSTKEEALGTDWLQFFPSSQHDELRGRLARVLDTGAVEAFETSSAGPTGRMLSFSVHMGPLRDCDRIVGAVTVAKEITALRRHQTEFATARRLTAVGTLAAGVAHEINTPVQFVSDSIHFLRDTSRDIRAVLEKLQVVRSIAASRGSREALESALAEAAVAEEAADLEYVFESAPKAFDRCVDGLDRVATIVRAMKEFAHPSQREMEPADLNHAIENTLTITRNEYKYVADLETQLGDLPPVTCCINDINQVILNLVVNAAHAIAERVRGSDQKGLITVRTFREGDHAVVSISDTGAGIAEDIADRVFEPFFTTKEVGKGTGQGLALAWDVITEKHRGELRFESQVEVGTTFFIRLPLEGSPHRGRSGGAHETHTVC
ncbi:MAG: PAS domain-containing protein, partial [Polyangiaceae bacterium]|nr:PAS domain-containing protein [Polyangiaceae bacterium]